MAASCLHGNFIKCHVACFELKIGLASLPFGQGNAPLLCGVAGNTDAQQVFASAEAGKKVAAVFSADSALRIEGNTDACQVLAACGIGNFATDGGALAPDQ